MKYKGIKIIKTSGLEKLWPWYRWFRAVAEYPHIRLREDLYLDLTSSKPSYFVLGTLEHEIRHLERTKQTGKLKFRLKYAFLPKFRLQEELEADKARFKYLKKNKQKFDFDQRAKHLSSWGYLWMISFKDAQKALHKLWQES